MGNILQKNIEYINISTRGKTMLKLRFGNGIKGILRLGFECDFFLF